MMFKVLPDAKVAWRDVWVGAALTALLFTIGKFAIGLYLGKSDVGSTYGAAGSLVIVLVWVYYSAQILLFGAEFTQVYANQVGMRIVPSKNATVADPEKAKKPGIQDPRLGGRNVDTQPNHRSWAAREAALHPVACRHPTTAFPGGLDSWSLACQRSAPHADQQSKTETGGLTITEMHSIRGESFRTP